MQRGQRMGEIIRRTKDGRFLGWYLRYIDADGRRKQRASHQPSRELARKMLVEIEARIVRGLVGMPEPKPLAPTVALLCERFLTEYRRPQIKDLDKYRKFAGCALRRALPTLGAHRADAVLPAHLNQLREALSRSCAPGSASLTLTFLKTAFSWAVHEGLVSNNPLRRVVLPARQESIEYLSSEEVKALLTAADHHAATGALAAQRLRVCVHFAVRTGLRKGELFGLRWCDLELATGRLTVARSFATTPKSGKTRHLRLPAAVIPMLTEWRTYCPATPEGLVFPHHQDGRWGMLGNTSAMLGLRELLVAAGCRPIARAWHALRHTFASHFIMSGGNVLSLQQILGHSAVKQTLIYSHLAPDFLAAEIDRVKF